MAVADAQSERCVSDKGLHGYKQIQGRKRQLAVDTNERMLVAHVGLANENDRTSGRAVLEKLHHQGFTRLQFVLAGTGSRYNGRTLAKWAQARCGWHLQTTPGLTGRGGFTLQLIRWVVECSINWLHWNQRLSRDFECETSNA